MSKELDMMSGLNSYDYGARQYHSVMPAWERVDPLCEKYYNISPYAYCGNNPVKYIDPDGKKVELYATKLPNEKLDWWPMSTSTHTFLVIRDKNNKVTGYFAYGPEGNMTGRLMKASYQQDKDVYEGKNINALKLVKEVPVPEKYKENPEEFDKAVKDAANSFGNNPDIEYQVFPNDETEGNCNTSTSTILLKAGVSPETIKQIEEEIPGINYGFWPKAKPWNKEEQKEAVKRNNERKKNIEEVNYKRMVRNFKR